MTVAELPPPRRAPFAEWSARAALFGLTVRQHTHGRRLLVLALLYLLPCALAIVLRSVARPAPADALEFALVLTLLPHGLAPLTALLYAAGVVSDEVEDQTLTAYVKPEGGTEAVAVNLKPDPQPGDASGKTSSFVGSVPRVKASW